MIKLKKAILSDKLYFNCLDYDGKISELRNEYFTYCIKDNEFITVLNINENDTLCSVPIGNRPKFEIDTLVDNRFIFEKNNWEFNKTLFEHQKEVAEQILIQDKLYSGIIKAPCSWGKTFLGCYLIAKYGKPTLILTHSKLLAYQWFKELNNLIEPKQNIGFLGDGKYNIEKITVGIYHTVVNNLEELKEKFEFLLVDEVHRCPARVFSSVVNNLSCKIKIGLSATPTRKDGLHVLLTDYFGPNRINGREVNMLSVFYKIIETDIPFTIINPNKEWARALNKLSLNKKYVDIIVNNALTDINEGRCVLILSERLELLKSLQTLIPNSILLIGETNNEDREDILLNVGNKYSVILSTRIFDEGISCHRLDTLYLTCPSNNPELLKQRIGRIQRYHPDKKEPLVKDFWLKGNIVKNQQIKRLNWYVSNNIKQLNI